MQVCLFFECEELFFSALQSLHDGRAMTFLLTHFWVCSLQASSQSVSKASLLHSYDRWVVPDTCTWVCFLRLSHFLSLLAFFANLPSLSFNALVSLECLFLVLALSLKPARSYLLLLCSSTLLSKGLCGGVSNSCWPSTALFFHLLDSRCACFQYFLLCLFSLSSKLLIFLILPSFILFLHLSLSFVRNSSFNWGWLLFFSLLLFWYSWFLLLLSSMDNFCLAILTWNAYHSSIRSLLWTSMQHFITYQVERQIR